MKIVVIGGTGLIGSKAVPMLRQGGHEVLAGSPHSGINSITGEGLTEAMAGTQVVIDLTNSPSFELTFRTLCRTSEAILEEPPVERGSGAIDRHSHAP
jgi:nucleoside-diphosphate-sugar epimerase